MDGEFRTKAEERTHLTKIIQEWNASRLDMFALTIPDKDLQFHGVMRFYFQDSGMKVVTKCIRVSSKTTVGELMDTLVEKFCPDMKMLTISNYELFECHEKGDTRKLGKSERPLLVQLSWHRDDREGRFLLKSASAKVSTKFFDINPEEGQFKRNLSRREKKELKKKRKQEALKEKENKGHDDTAISQQLYTELPENSLTRSISNPEAVMKRRRQQKLEKRLKEFQSNDGGQTGGTLKIFAETLKPEIPYKTILASIHQTSDKIVKDALDKFQLDENPDEFCLVMAMIPPGDNPGPGKERVVRDDDCPLAIQSSWPSSRGFLTFHLRKRYTVAGFKKDRPGKQKAADTQADRRVAERLAHNSTTEDTEKEWPYLEEIVPKGRESKHSQKVMKIAPNVTKIGSSQTPLSEQYFHLYAPDILHEHCVIANMEGVVTITPSYSEALVIVDGQQIQETMVLRNGSIIKFGETETFRFYNENDIRPPSQTSSLNRSFDDQLNTSRSSNLEQMPTDQLGDNGNRSFNAEKSFHESVSPVLMERILSEQSGSKVDDEMIVETTFGVDGEIESSPVRKTAPKGFTKSSTDVRELEKENERRMFDMHFGQSAPDLVDMDNEKGLTNGPVDHGMNNIPLLPASLEFIDDAQDAFLAAIISEVNGSAVHFKLAPAYSLYLACHYMISTDYRPELGSVEHARAVGATTRKMAIAIERTIEENDGLAGSLAFWLANASELLHFLRQDMELSPLTQNAQGILSQTVQQGFRLLVLAMEDELALAMPAFLDPSEHADIPVNELEHILEDDVLERAESSDLLNWTSDERTFPVQDGRPISGHHWVTPATRIRHHGQPVLADVLYILSSAVLLLRRCRINAALTIQLFSRLFHFINMWLFNKLVLEPQLGLCTRAWGKRLRRRLSYVEAWAEKQGLELAADCHLCRVVQAAHLLEAPKISAEDIASISSTCFKLNSLQLRALLRMYRPDRTEHVIPHELIESVAAVAEHTADELARSDGREVRLDEDEELQLPFLLPEDGYSCDIIRGVPAGLQEFLEILIQTGICRFAVEPVSTGLWTVHQEQFYYDNEKPEFRQNLDQPYEDEKPEVLEVTLQKGNKGLGLSIVAAKGPNSEDLGIYIKGVVAGGAADQNGMLQPGDQLLSVNGISLVGVSQETAAKLMGKADSKVTLEVLKQAAVYHGLAALLNEPSPVSSPVSRPNERLPYDTELSMSPTIQEQSPQIRTQRWIAMNNNKETEDDGDLQQDDYEANELERSRREEEEYYQAQENKRVEEERSRMEYEKWQRDEQERLEEMRREEERRQEEREIEQRRLQEEELRKENLRKMEEARIAEAKRIEEERQEEERRKAEEKRLEEEDRMRAERKRIEDEERRRAEEKRLEEEEKRRAEERRLEEEEEQKRMEEEREKEEEAELLRKQEEEQRKFEQRQREYEERIRIMEEQQQKMVAEKRMREEEERQRQLEEQRRFDEERKQQEERKRLEEQKAREEERRREDERKREEERKRQEEKRELERRREEEERRRMEERKRQEEERRKLVEERRLLQEESLRQEEERRLREEQIRQEKQMRIQEDKVHSEVREQQYSSLHNTGGVIDGDLDDLPPPPEELLDFEEDTLEMRIQSQLAAEREEHREIEREQQKWKEFDNYEETDIDNVDDKELELQIQNERESLTEKDRSYTLEDPNDIEREFQRRLQQENQRKNRNRNAIDDHDEIAMEKMRVDREYRVEQERKIKLMIEDHDRRKAMRQSTREPGFENGLAEQQKRMQQLRINPSQDTNSQDDWMSLQRQKRLQQKQEQERIRNEQRESDEQERQRKLKEVREQKEQEQRMMQEYKRQKELDEQRNIEMKQKEEERLRQQKDEAAKANRIRSNVVNVKPHVEYRELVKDEFKEKAVADYDRRRATLDKEVEKQEHEKRIRSLNFKAPPVAKKPQSTGIGTNEDEDEPPPPRPPPPSSVPVTAMKRVTPSPSPSPHLPNTTRFSYSAKTVSNVNAGNYSRTSSASPNTSSLSPASVRASPTSPANKPYQHKPMLSNRSASRDDPSVLDFRQKMKMFGESQKSSTNNDIRSTFSKKQRDYMD